MGEAYSDAERTMEMYALAEVVPKEAQCSVSLCSDQINMCWPGNLMCEGNTKIFGLRDSLQYGITQIIDNRSLRLVCLNFMMEYDRP